MRSFPFRPLSHLLVSGSLCATLLGGALLTVPAAASATPAALAWQPCTSTEPTKAECATVPVPIDWSKPDGPKIGIAVARQRATDTSRRIGALLLNPGGPGGSGVDWAMAPGDLGKEIRARFDLLGWDPRGIERSKPLACDTTRYDPNLYFPRSQAELQLATDQNKRLGLSCQQRSGLLAAHMDTVSGVRDMEAIRVALGEAKVSYYGVSYGTQIGQHYAELFGDRLRAIVIDSNIDHSQDTAGYQHTQAESQEALLTEFAAWCGRTAGCPLGSTDAREVVRRLLDRADRGKLGSWRTHQVQSVLFDAMYLPDDWSQLAQLLKDLDVPKPPAPEAADPSEYIYSAQYYAVTCQDNRWPVSGYPQLSQLEGQLRRVAPVLRYSVLAWGDLTGCHGWPTPVRNPQHRLKPKAGTPPVLVAGVRHDPATPYGWSVAVHRQLPGSTLLTYDGAGHGAYFRDGCAQRLIDQYLLTLRQPKPGTHCPATWPKNSGSLVRHRPGQSIQVPLPIRPSARG